MLGSKIFVSLTAYQKLMKATVCLYFSGFINRSAGLIIETGFSKQSRVSFSSCDAFCLYLHFETHVHSPRHTSAHIAAHIYYGDGESVGSLLIDPLTQSLFFPQYRGLII